MKKVKTNIFEILLKEILIGKVFYDKNDNKIKIDDVNYSPLLNTVYIKSGNDGYSLSTQENYFFELDDNFNGDKIKPNKGKVKPNNK